MIVDANVFKGFYQVEIGKAHALCGCPQKLLRSVSPTQPLFHDMGGVIEHEWEAVVDREWFAAWLSASLQAGTVRYAPAAKIAGLEKQLQSLGFPPSRDLIYVRAAHAVATMRTTCRLYSEDLDFFDPKMKGCAAGKRLKVLKSSSGPVCRLLAKHGVDVRCVP